MNRREFLKISTGVAATALAGCSFRMNPAEQVRAPESSVIPLSEREAFNYAVGTQTIGASYQFTKKPLLVETAEAIRDMGASVIKFRLGGTKKEGFQPGRFQNLRDLAAHDPVTKTIFNMPFGHYLLWTYPLGSDRIQPRSVAGRDEEIYDLCCYLLRAYNGTRKVFYLGHWEGDWQIRGGAGNTADPTPERIAQQIRWLNHRQQAVDDAKRDTPHSHVEVYCYAEVNLVRDAMRGRPTMTHDVVPNTHIDFVSYSSYDTSNGNEIETAVPEALGYIESKLAAKAGLNGKRVWIGEYGYPACRFSPQEQDARTRRLIKTALGWGCPFVLYWEMYNNEVDEKGQRGFWLIDDKGVKQPVYHTHHQFCHWARRYVADFNMSTRRLPNFDEYRKAALAFLDS